MDTGNHGVTTVTGSRSRTRALLPVAVAVVGVVLGAVVAVLVAPAPPAVAAPEVVRISGDNRYATAAEVSREFDRGVPRVFLATGQKFPDALAATAVAGSLGAPILLVREDAIPTATREALQRLRPRAITVMGGASVVAPGVVAEAKDFTTGPVARVGGDNRYETASKLVDSWYDPGVPVAWVATGDGFADSLSSGPAAASGDAPLVLVRPDGVPEPTARTLRRLAPARLVVVGGAEAIDDQVVAELEALTGAPAERVAGPGRYATSAEVVGTTFPGNPRTVYLATGTDFPDALAGGALAGDRVAPLVTTRPDCVPQEVLDELERIGPDRVVLLGGREVLGTGVADLDSCAPGPRVRARTIQSGLDVPWDLVFTPDGRTYLNERDTGRVLRRHGDGRLEEVVAFDVDNDHEGGLTGLAVAPSWDEDSPRSERWLYAMYVAEDGQRVVRFHPDGMDVEVVVDGLPTGPEGNQSHFSGRIDFGPDGMLYVAVGDVRMPARAQDPASLSGKILRYTPDGAVPPDNPFVAGPDDPIAADDPVWALGFRDPQGMAWDGDGRMYASEFGPNRDDEINTVVPGGNYGWPETTGTRGDDPAHLDPIVVRQPPEASWSGISVLQGGAVPEWEGDLFVAALRGQRLYRVDLEDGEVVDVEERLVGTYGRLRHAVPAPDGSLWLLTSNQDDNGDPDPGDDRIVRLAP